jgi:site-specific DNA-methyltransferase (adenine-specific)
MLELNKLYLMNCMEGMATFPDKYFDLAIVDPPYGIGIGTSVGGGKPFGKNGRDKFISPKVYRGFNDSKPPEQKYFDEIKRIAKEQIIWGGNYFISKLTDTSCMIVWDKDNSGNFADCELAWTSFKTAVRLFRYRWNGLLQENMKDKEIRIHPTQKPVALYKWILKNYAKPEYKIIDTHAGSCSSVIVFLEFGCQWIAFEIDKDYYEAANKRIENHKRQLKFEFA